MLDHIAMHSLFVWFIVFCRIGGAMMVLPVIGEIYILPRYRLLLAVATSVLMTPVLADMFPPIPKSILEVGIMIIKELIIGLALGVTSRMLISAMHIAGMIIAYQSGLASATLFDPSQGTQGSMAGNFLSLLATILVISFGVHHLMIYGVVDSYELFRPQDPLQVESFSQLAVSRVSSSFLIAIKVTSPALIIGVILNLGAGILARLMPSMHIFFVIVPIQIVVVFFVLLAAMSGIMMWYLEYVRESLEVLLPS